MKLKKILGFLFALIVFIPSISFASYIANKTIDTSVSNQTYTGGKKYKITFKGLTDEEEDTVMYVDAGYHLSLKDAPFVSDGTNVYEWIENDNVTNLATFDGDIKDGMVFSAKSIGSNEETLETNYDPSISLTASNSMETSLAMTEDDYIDFNAPSYTGTSSSRVWIPTGSRETSNIGYNLQTNFQNNSEYGQIGTHFTYSDNLSSENSIVNTLNGSFCYYSSTYSRYIYYSDDTKNYNGDLTIALADTEGKTTDYKPFEGYSKIGGSDELVSAYNEPTTLFGQTIWGSSSYARYNTNTTTITEITSATLEDYNQFAATNYICKKFTLQRDVIFNGVDFTLGAHNGFYGSNINWAQNNYNNFIVGAYTEIDLNGHDLILTNGSTLTAYGSITDSSGDKGTIVVENGSALKGLLTLEDCAHETDVFIYYFNLSLFRMFRMPYLDCNIDIKYGGNLKGICMKDSGGRSYQGFTTEISLIGTDNESLITMTGDQGHIVRSVSYDEDIVNDNSTSYIIRNNLYNQRIKYSVYDCDIDFNYFVMDLSSYSIEISSADSQFIVPSYFEIYLYNSTVNLDAELVFLPGSYLYVDEDSTINFCFTSFSSQRGATSINTVNLYRSGGLIFAQYFWSMYNAGLASLRRSSTTLYSGNDSVSPNIYNVYGSHVFWQYMSENRPARCDLYGTFTFTSISSTDYPGYVLSGTINDYRNNESLDLYNDDSVYKNQTQPGIIPCLAHASRSIGGGYNASYTLNGTGNFMVMNYINAPIISQGVIVSDNSNIDGGTYDARTGLVTNGTNTYALIMNSGFLNSWYQDDQLQLSGTYQEVTYNSTTHSISSNSTTYIYYQGIYLEASDGANSTYAYGVNLDWMIGGNSGRGATIDSTDSCTMTYNSSNKWQLTTVA